VSELRPSLFTDETTRDIGQPDHVIDCVVDNDVMRLCPLMLSISIETSTRLHVTRSIRHLAEKIRNVMSIDSSEISLASFPTAVVSWWSQVDRFYSTQTVTRRKSVKTIELFAGAETAI